MSKEQAFQVLVQALAHANKQGAFELKDSATIFQAVNILGQSFEQVDQPQSKLTQAKEEEVEEKPVKKSSKK